MLHFKDFTTFISSRQNIQESTDKVNRTDRTQVATTGGTYEKTGKYLSKILDKKSRILSVGAGLDQTKEGLLKGLDVGHEVHDHEPNPQNRRVAPEYTNADHIPSDHYHASVTHNVLNVVEPHIRDSILHHMFRTTQEGGHMIIGTRGWTGDVANAKHFEPVSGEEKAIWVKKSEKDPKTKKSNTIWSYQKGFDGDELKNYIEDFAKKYGHDVTVKKIGGLAKNTVHVKINKKSPLSF